MKDEIIEMARQAGLFEITKDGYEVFYPDNLEAFAKLVAAKEREACAKLVQESWMAFSRAPNSRLDITPFPELEYVAKVIRARGDNANSM
jgi:hypothetical protein